MTVRVCATDPATVFAGGRVIDVFVDGNRVARLTNLAPITLQLAQGTYGIRAELLSAQHVVLTPRVFVQQTVMVTQSGPSPVHHSC